MLSIIPKAKLSTEQANLLEKRLSAAEHQHDIGPSQVWHIYNNGTLYAVVEKATGRPIGIVDASGDYDAANVGWWIDKEFRGQGYGNALIDTMATYLMANGYTGAGAIKIDTYRGEYQIASTKLKKRFLAHFGQSEKY